MMTFKTFLAYATLGTSLSAAAELGDFSISYGYKYLGDARREGTLSQVNKLPGAFSFTLDPKLVLHVGSDTFKHAKLIKQLSRSGAGDTSLGVTLKAFTDTKTLGVKL